MYTDIVFCGSCDVVRSARGSACSLTGGTSRQPSTIAIDAAPRRFRIVRD